MSDTKPDLDVFVEWAKLQTEETEEQVRALVAYARTLEAAQSCERVTAYTGEHGEIVTGRCARAEAAEAERDQLRDTLTRRTAAHDRLTQRLDQIRALVDDPAWVIDFHGEVECVSVEDLRRVLDGDQRTETP